MGKIRVKALGDEDLEREQKKQAKKRKEEKKTAKSGKAGERVATVGPTEEELAGLNEKPATTESTEKITEGTEKISGKQLKHSAKTVVARKARERSKRYKSAKIQIDRNKTYKLQEALEILPKIAANKFDETVELHLNTIEKGVSGNLNLPHGTGKKTRVAVATDEIIAQVEKGKIDFDILLAVPEMMPRLAKVAKYLGPRGLMPNPKAGTITKNPEEVVKKFEGGQINYKTEAKAPIIHLTVGKLSFGKDKLEENIKTVFSQIQSAKIQKAILKSTMSPGIKVDFAKV